MAEKNKENEAREILIKLKYIENQMAGLQGQLQMLERGRVELTATKTALDSLKELKKDSNSLLPLGSGMFAKGTLAKQESILIDVGAGAIIEKTIPEAEKILEEREKDIFTNTNTFQQMLLSLDKQYGELAEKARALAG
jgi:prefoldin alpha subunit